MLIDEEHGRARTAPRRACSSCVRRASSPSRSSTRSSSCARKVTTVAHVRRHAHYGYGGTQQESALRRGVDVVIGTPGRICRHDRQRRRCASSDVLFVVLDEADEMLNMGFQKDVEEILEKLPASVEHQTLMFSATMPPWVESVARKHLRADARHDRRRRHRSRSEARFLFENFYFSELSWCFVTLIRHNNVV
jgi:superfamily II DNA/RNA helicase